MKNKETFKIELHCGIYAMEYYSAIKKNEILLFATTWIDLEGIVLSEICQEQNKQGNQTKQKQTCK